MLYYCPYCMGEVQYQHHDERTSSGMWYCVKNGRGCKQGRNGMTVNVVGKQEGDSSTVTHQGFWNTVSDTIDDLRGRR